LPLLASLKEKSTCREFSCFFEAEDKDGLEEDDLADKATKDVFALLWEAIVLLVMEVLSCFQK